MSRTWEVSTLILGLTVLASRTVGAQGVGLVSVTATVSASTAPAASQGAVGLLIGDWRVHPGVLARRSTEYGRLDLTPPAPASPERRPEPVVVTIQYLRN